MRTLNKIRCGSPWKRERVVCVCEEDVVSVRM